jgi:hypothetical protein
MTARSPYVVGQWVRGATFYGRDDEIATILGAEHAAFWLVGMRRIGKTSLLRQLELLTSGLEHRWMPLYWDLQGVETAQDLRTSYEEAFEDAGNRLVSVGLNLGTLVDHANQPDLHYLAAMLAQHQLRALLLCDEAESLVALSEREPAATKLLGHALTAGAVDVVVASSVRLAPLVDGCKVPLAGLKRLYLTGLHAAAAIALIQQDHLPPTEKPPLTPESIGAIERMCGGHPFLLQLLCKRVCELGDPDEARAVVGSDPMIATLMATDFALLPEPARNILWQIARGTFESRGTLEGELSLLRGLGLLAAGSMGPVHVSNAFLQRWLTLLDQP